ncbi:Alpha/Beta hydrolase protein [Chaetomium tenue]|uniref:Alpha/Beta hydrolase protein n=1 Tax=Chaetomium tenue TaxID=1854479 RepID=A0ACB7PJY8_9PEZI|nr:Alpha/Beta hydrolase protein [Chaetomium globosum]
MGSHSMFDEQPSLIQIFDPDTAPTPTPPTPLVLIHDGGGTIFSYHCLGELGRTVHGIANPHYESAQPWTGGIPEMARHYLAFVESVIPPGGEVILGGWSLGGLLALEMAAQAAADERGQRIRVVGILMVDSVCPLAEGAVRPAVVVPHAVQWHEHTRPETREKVTWCFAEAVRMVGEWTLPAWEGKAGGGPSPPPVVMLRARERVPVGEGVARVDLHRSDRLLGWGGYRKDLIREIIDIPGHHYNVFDTEDNLDAATEAIMTACSVIERLDGSRAFC